MSTPLVSIVIPAFNHGAYLKQAIDSVMNQDYPNIELIVLDDGSTDDTRAVLESYGKRFHWESQKNMGQANTLNKGWQMAKGDILSYLSADDVLQPNAVSVSVRHLHDDTVLTYGDFNMIDPSSNAIRRVTAPDFYYGDMFAKFICHPGPGVFFTRKAFEKAGLWDNSLRQMPDYDYWLRLGLAGNFMRIPEVLAAFRVHEESQTHAKADRNKADEPVYIMRRFIESRELPPNLARRTGEALGNAHLVAAQLHIRANRFGIGMWYMWKAFVHYPYILLFPRTYRVLLNALFNHLLHKLARLKNRF